MGNSRRSSKASVGFLIGMGVIVLCILAGVLWRHTLLQRAADYLIVDETMPSSTDAIIVLGGEVLGERTRKGAELYHKGIAPNMIISDGTDLSWRLKTGEEMMALAKHLGIPDESIHWENRSRSTYENALYSKEVMEEKGWRSAVVVTTEWHSRRASFIFEKVFQGTEIELHYDTAMDPIHGSLDRWWEDSEKQQTVLTEWARLLYYWVKY